MINMTWHHMGTCAGCSDCACVSSGPSHAPMQQQSGQVQSAIPSASLSLPASGYGSSAPASGYSHAAPSSQGSMIQGPGPGYGSSSSSSSTSSSSSSSSRSNLNMQSNQGEPGIEEPNHQDIWSNFMERNTFRLMDSGLDYHKLYSQTILQDASFVFI